jgi:hypothetical protein
MMTDLRELLERAAGDDPVVSDADLTADLHRGRRAIHRRRAASVTAAAAGTALAVGTAWLLAPGAATTGTPRPPIAASTTPRVKASLPPGMPSIPTRPPMAWAAKPVALVPNHDVVAGARITCDLMPKGWIFGLYKEGNSNHIWVRDPNSTYPHQEPPGFHDGWESGDGNSVFFGTFGDKVGNGWKAQVTTIQDGKEAAVFTDRGNMMRGRPGEVFVRLSKSVTIQAEIGPRTGWDSPTAVRWAASCHPVR